MTDHTLSHNERLLAFVEHMARMSTPTDPDKIVEFRNDPIFKMTGLDDPLAMTDDEIKEEIESDLPGDTAYDDALAFYAMIRQARALTGEAS